MKTDYVKTSNQLKRLMEGIANISGKSGDARMSVISIRICGEADPNIFRIYEGEQTRKGPLNFLSSRLRRVDAIRAHSI